MSAQEQERNWQEFFLREMQVAVRMMIRDNATEHCFDLGTGTLADGRTQELECIILIRDKGTLASWFGGDLIVKGTTGHSANGEQPGVLGKAEKSANNASRN